MPVCENGAEACSDTRPCKDHYTCKKDTKDAPWGCCAQTERTGPNCCPGQVANRLNRCTDKFDECTTDPDCGDVGDRFCLPYHDPFTNTDGSRCNFKRCDDYAGQCPARQSCFNGMCVAQAPCNGICPAGSACVPADNQCFDYGSRCAVSCGPGFLAVFTDSTNVYDPCDLNKVACECAELPPLISHDLGRYSAVATSTATATVSVSMYDGEYGDLVVNHYDASGRLVKMDYVDGVPQGGAVIGGPSGPRRGISDKGDDVGRYTDIAASADGTLHLSYYDVTHGDLKYAERRPDGTWIAPYTIDGDGADTGLYTSIAVDKSSGGLGIAYFQRASSATGPACPGDSSPASLLTAVRYAHTSNPHPSSSGDWTVTTAECKGRPPPPCYGCTASQVCVELTGGSTQCAKPHPAADCAPSTCSANQTCADTGATPSCMTNGNPNPLIDIYPGVGLFPSLAYQGPTPVIAYYDRIKGDLRAAVGNGSSFTAVTIDGSFGAKDTGDVGRFPSVAIDPTSSKIAIAYQGVSDRSLRFFYDTTLYTLPEAQQTYPTPAQIIDNGIAPVAGDGPSYVGADVSLLFSGAGLVAVYQNSTASDLRLATLQPSGWAVAQEWKTGALGFFADVAELSGSLFVSHAQLHTLKVNGTAVLDNTLHLEVYKP